MRIQTLSIVVGSAACNAKCGFCVSRMTGFERLPNGKKINYRHLQKALLWAHRGGVTTVLLTGKGEPTLYPFQITGYLNHLESERAPDFPTIELQTNGIDIGRLAAGQPTQGALTRSMLESWYHQGLDTVAISVVGIKPSQNAECYLGSREADYPDLVGTMDFLHELGFSVRLCVMLQRGYTEHPDHLAEIVGWCQSIGVEQITARPIRQPRSSADGAVADYVTERALRPDQEAAFRRYADAVGTRLLELAHGAIVYDIRGQNLCLSDCLTTSVDPDQMRQLIFYADGRLTYDWQHEGAVLLGGRGGQ